MTCLVPSVLHFENAMCSILKAVVTCEENKIGMR